MEDKQRGWTVKPCLYTFKPCLDTTISLPPAITTAATQHGSSLQATSGSTRRPPPLVPTCSATSSVRKGGSGPSSWLSIALKVFQYACMLPSGGCGTRNKGRRWDAFRLGGTDRKCPAHLRAQRRLQNQGDRRMVP